MPIAADGYFPNPPREIPMAEINTNPMMQGETNNAVQDMTSRAQDKVADMTARMTEARRMIARRASDYAALADRQVHEQPWTAVGISAGVAFAGGVLLGLLIGSTRK
jgi:ElaB/YqjD/DUF883 family membrane-anchored ribosome-binding protein